MLLPGEEILEVKSHLQELTMLAVQFHRGALGQTLLTIKKIDRESVTVDATHSQNQLHRMISLIYLWREARLKVSVMINATLINQVKTSKLKILIWPLETI